VQFHDLKYRFSPPTPTAALLASGAMAMNVSSGGAVIMAELNIVQRGAAGAFVTGAFCLTSTARQKRRVGSRSRSRRHGSGSASDPKSPLRNRCLVASGRNFRLCCASLSAVAVNAEMRLGRRIGVSTQSKLAQSLRVRTTAQLKRSGCPLGGVDAFTSLRRVSKLLGPLAIQPYS
jgi:hypothetical protein